ncbi:MAG: PilZ domain-containing protein [Planctomycetes bacterium]|nr:PilZ domain-containing protein [Planctomycetota bacterium]MCB9910300.1 PilZ domain-containing protein [Planctomycetota bacterium]HRV81108.1 PilZ domain-containing protein [Planctomycetota bacterium]
MSFRNPDTLPIAYLVRPGHESTLCCLHTLQTRELEAEPLVGGSAPWAPGETVYLALEAQTTDPSQCVRGRITGQHGDRLQIELADPKAFWSAAQVAQSYNRRQAFRVCTRNLLPSPTKPAKEALQVSLHQGPQATHAEMLDLSLTGCGIRIRREGSMAPPLGTLVFLEAEGGDLDERLRLPARIERYQERGRYLYLGLAFARSETRLWKQLEDQIARYLMTRQQRLLGRKAG